MSDTNNKTENTIMTAIHSGVAETIHELCTRHGIAFVLILVDNNKGRGHHTASTNLTAGSDMIDILENSLAAARGKFGRPL